MYEAAIWSGSWSQQTIDSGEGPPVEPMHFRNGPGLGRRRQAG
jgi:hypothetical protein